MKANDLVRKLTSRKFLMAFGGFLVGLLPLLGVSEDIAVKVTGLVLVALSMLGYILVEGALDFTSLNGTLGALEDNENNEKPKE